MRSPPEGGISVLDTAVDHRRVQGALDAGRPEGDGPDRRTRVDEDGRALRVEDEPTDDRFPAEARTPARGEDRGGPGIAGPLGLPPRPSLRGRPPCLLVGVSVHPQAAPPQGGRRHRRPGHVGLRHPALLDLRQHGVDRARRQVAPDDVAEVGVLLPDHPHPDPQHPLPQRRHRVDPPGLAGLRLLRCHLDEAVPFELGQGPVDRGTVHVAEAELRQTRHQAVAVSRLLGQEEQDRRQHEAAGRGELEPRHTLGLPGLPDRAVRSPCGERSSP